MIRSRRVPRRGARGNALSEAASSSPPAPRVSCVYLILFGSGFAGLGLLTSLRTSSDWTTCGMRRSGSPPEGAGPLGRKARWRAPERLGGHERLIGPALDLAQAVFGFPDHFFDSRHCRFVMNEITKSPIAL